MNQQIFYASIVEHGGKHNLLLRKFISDPSDVEHIAKQILESGVYEFHGVLIFRNPIVAIQKMIELEMLPKDFLNKKLDFKYIKE